jgi:hypothetical protein
MDCTFTLFALSASTPQRLGRDVTGDIARETKEWTDKQAARSVAGLRDFIDWRLALGKRARAREISG